GKRIGMTITERGLGGVLVTLSTRPSNLRTIATVRITNTRRAIIPLAIRAENGEILTAAVLIVPGFWTIRARSLRIAEIRARPVQHRAQWCCAVIFGGLQTRIPVPPGFGSTSIHIHEATVVAITHRDIHARTALAISCKKCP